MVKLNVIADIKQSHLWLYIKTRYELLSSRDRMALQWLMVFFSVLVFYLVIWSPLSDWQQSQEEDYERQYDILEWMSENHESVKLQQTKKKALAGQKDISSILSGTAKQAGVLLSRVQPDRKGVGVWIDDVAYQKLLGWMVTINTKYDLSIHQVRLDKNKEEGRVKVYLHLGQQ